MSLKRKKKQSKYENGCEKYNKTVDEIAEAASRHREKILALMEVLDAQKEKVFCLRGHRNELFDEIDKMNREYNIEIKYRNEKLSSLQEENVVIKGQLNDQNEELEMMKTKLYEMDKSVSSKQEVTLFGKSLEQELMFANDNQEKEKIMKELNSMKKIISGVMTLEVLDFLWTLFYPDKPIFWSL